MKTVEFKYDVGDEVWYYNQTGNYIKKHKIHSCIYSAGEESNYYVSGIGTIDCNEIFPSKEACQVFASSYLDNEYKEKCKECLK